MKISLLLSLIIVLMVSCGNDKSGQTAKTFCDTTCSSDSFKFNGSHKWKPYVTISVKNCVADTLTWSHENLPAERKMQMPGLLGKPVRINKSAIACFIKDAA